MNTITGTTAEIAEKIGLEYTDARGLLAFLVKQGIAKQTGKRAATGGKGKPSILFEIPNRIECTLVPAVPVDTEVLKEALV